MKYLIEKEYDDIELNIILDLLKYNKYLHDFVIVQDKYILFGMGIEMDTEI